MLGTMEHSWGTTDLLYSFHITLHFDRGLSGETLPVLWTKTVEINIKKVCFISWAMSVVLKANHRFWDGWPKIAAFLDEWILDACRTGTGIFTGIWKLCLVNDVFLYLARAVSHYPAIYLSYCKLNVIVLIQSILITCLALTSVSLTKTIHCKTLYRKGKE